MQTLGTSSPETGKAQPSRSPGTPTRKRFALTGRSHVFDPRIDAARGDLADIRLADRLFAPHYAAAVPRTALRRTPLAAAAGGGAVSEVLAGETFDVLEISRGLAWGVSAVDGAVGFVSAEAIGAAAEMTHVVCAPMAARYDDEMLPMGSRIGAADASRFDPDAIRPLGAAVADFVALAETLVGAPAAAGGRSGAGVDCSGLVFLTLSLGGITAPRFVDLQAAALGHPVGGDAPMLRGDLLFFYDHAAIVASDGEAIHVGAAGDAVVRESIASILDGGAFGALVARRRLP